MHKQKMRFILKGTIAGLLALLFMVPVVYAQEDDENTFMLEEITVTAEKRETDLQKTPISIQTVSGVELTTEAKTRIDEIMQGVVGVQTQGSQVGTDFFMRGVGKAEGNGPPAGLQQSAVAVVIDGVYQNRGEVVRGGTVDMAQAEVMRGTQSTTLGGSSFAGAVSMVSNNPVFDYEGSGSLGVGDYNLLTTQAVLNVPLAEDQAFRIAYSSERRDGYLGSNAGNSDQSNGRIKYRYQPTETFNLVATVSKQVIGGNGVDVNSLSYYGYWESYNADNAANYDATIGYPVLYGHVTGEKYEDRDDPWDDSLPSEGWPNNVFRHTNIYQYSLNLDWDLNIGTLSVIPSYQTAEFSSQESPRGSQNNSEFWNAEQREQETVQLDVQLASSVDAPFKWLAGLYYYDTEETGVMYGAELSANSATYGWSSRNPNTQTSYAVYGNATYPILDVLRVNAGVRYTKDEKVQRETGRDNTVYSFVEPAASEFVYDPALEGDWDAITYRVGGEYDLTDDTMIYALYATGYQPGQLAMDGTDTDNQEVDQYTVGVKSDLMNSRLRLNVEGFHQMYYNRDFRGALQVYSEDFISNAGRSTCGLPGPPPPPGTPIYDIDPGGSYYCLDITSGATIPELVSVGVDVEINYLITENDRIDLSAEWLKSEQDAPEHNVSMAMIQGLTNIDAIDGLATTFMDGLDSAAIAYDGLTLQNSPEWSGNISYSHIFEMASGSTLTPKFNIEYRDTYWSSGGGPAATEPDPASSYQDAYQLYNFYLNWTSSDDRFNISAYVKNIEDKPILTNYGSEGMETVTLLPPRTMGVVFSVKL